MFNQLSRDIHLPGATKQISGLLSELAVVQIYGPVDAPVAGITTNSKAVAANWIFVAVEGTKTDGHNFIQQAIENGASAVVIQRKQYEEYLSHLLSPSYAQHTQTTVVVVEDTKLAVADLAAGFYDHPATKLRMIGITGTNGKTSSAYIIRKMFELAGESVGMLGTIEYSIAGTRKEASLTTPMAEDIQAMLAEMVAAKCTTCVMEVSSHALALKRVHGIEYDVSLYTNLSRDHLDFHGTFEEYASTKAMLFREHSRGHKILNVDDQYQYVIWPDRGEETITYGTSKEADIIVRDVQLGVTGTEFTLEYEGKTYRTRTQLVGSFSAMNAAGAFAVCVSAGMQPQDAIRGLEVLANVPGRLERIVGPNSINAFVDYSHTPDSLEKALRSLIEINNNAGRIIVVFGCGGDRDQGKRPLMGKIAIELSDIVIVTSDNPRSEPPSAIIDAIVAGIPQDAIFEVIEDRGAAIAHAVSIAKENDIILVAGKGHETYQILGKERVHFSDVEELSVAFSNKDDGAAE